MRFPWQKTPARSYDAATLVPRLKTPGFVMATRGLPDGQQPVVVPFVGDLLIAYAVDHRDAVRYLTQDEAAAFAGGADALAMLARANLVEFIQRPDVLELSNHDGLTSARLPGGLTASLMLVDDFWKEGLARIGPIAAVVPTRDELWFGAAAAEGNIDRLAKVVGARDFGHVHALVPHVLGYDASGWQAYAVGE